MEQQVQKILYLGGKESISRYDFGLLLGDILQLPTDSIKRFIKPDRQTDVVAVAPRSPDRSYRISAFTFESRVNQFM